jgi:uncharacterized protein
VFSAQAFVVSLGAGAVGSLLGLGGGIIVVPALTLLLGVDIRFAIGASIVSVIATSSGAAITYIRKNLAHLKLAMLLEVATVSGALVGASVAGMISVGTLYLLFGLLLFFVASMMLRRNKVEIIQPSQGELLLARRLDLVGTVDGGPSSSSYVIRNVPLGLFASSGAGIMSGLLGIGGGVIKVPLMNLAMGVPLKVASATSNLSIGLTASASALIYFSRGDINPFVVAPVALGVLLGAQMGSRLMGRIDSHWIKKIFVFLLLGVGIQMCWRWWGLSYDS